MRRLWLQYSGLFAALVFAACAAEDASSAILMDGGPVDPAHAQPAQKSQPLELALQNNGFESGLAPWFGQKKSAEGAIVAAPEMIALETVDTYEGSAGALRLTVARDGSSQYYSHHSGAIGTLGDSYPAGTTLRVEFAAKSLGGGEWVGVSRLWGGGQDYVRVTRQWARYVSYFTVTFGTNQLVFSINPVHVDNNLQPLVNGTVLIDDVKVRAAAPGEATFDDQLEGNLASNTNFDYDVLPCYGQKNLPQGFGPAPELISQETADTFGASAGALRLKVAVPTDATYYSHVTGAVCPSAAMIPVGTWVRLRFAAKSVSGVPWLGVSRVWGGGLKNVQISTEWARYETSFRVDYDTSSFVFSTIPHDLNNLQPLVDGEILIDDLEITAAVPPSGSVARFRADGCNPDANGLLSCRDLSGHGYTAKPETADKQPVLLSTGIGGMPTLVYQREQTMRFGDPSLTLSPSFTMVVVGQHMGQNAVHLALRPSATPGVGAAGLRTNAPYGTVKFNSVPPAGQTTANELTGYVCSAGKLGALTSGQAFAAVATGAPEQLGLHVNGASDQLVSSSSWPAALDGVLGDGQFAPEGATAMTVAEALVYNRTLSPLEIAQLYAYVQKRYGIVMGGCGPLVSCSAGDPSCARCGDGVVSGTEVCDPAAHAGCLADCSALRPCGDGVLAADEECDPALTAYCSEQCTVLDTPVVCDNPTQCAAGQECPKEYNGLAFGLGTQHVCAPVGLCPLACGADTRGPCGRCLPEPNCSTATPANPSDGIGGLCDGMCAPRQAGCCLADADCPGDFVCGIGLGVSFGGPAGSNACVPEMCRDFDPTRVSCGAPDAPCGTCRDLPNECETRVCGSDRFGHSCGTCASGSYCSEQGTCQVVAISIPKHRPDAVEPPVLDPAGAVGSLPGEFSVADNGAALYTLPIQLPPGRNGLTPELSLAYDSSTGDGFVGRGWSLKGLSAVRRCRRVSSLRRGDHIAGITMGPNDRFCLDGVALLQADSTLPYSAAQEYRSEADSFMKVVSSGGPTAGGAYVGPSKFTAHTRDGRIYEYTRRATAKMGQWARNEATFHHDEDSRVGFEWHLATISDQHGNFVYFDYDEFRSEHARGYPLWNPIEYTAEMRPRAIRYAGGRSIEFQYDGTEVDPYIRGLRGGVPRHLSWPLQRIDVRVEGKLTRSYELETETQGRSWLVRSVRMCAPAGTQSQCLPATRFDYDLTGGQFASPQLADKMETILIHFDTFGSDDQYNTDNLERFDRVVFDHNGDGLEDLLYRPAGRDYYIDKQRKWYVRHSLGALVDGSMFGPPILTDLPAGGIHGQPDMHGIHVLDMNDDGRDDIVHEGGIALADDSERGFTLVPMYLGRGLALVDLNDDGAKDAVSCEGYYALTKMNVRYNIGSKFDEPVLLADTPDGCWNTKELEFDGNGSTDLMVFRFKPDSPTDGEYGVLESTGATPQIRWIGSYPFHDAPRHYFDANGDGITDAVAATQEVVTGRSPIGHQYTNRWALQLYVGTGQGFVVDKTSAFSDDMNPDFLNGAFVADRNADGIEELYVPKWKGDQPLGWHREDPYFLDDDGNMAWKETETILDHVFARYKVKHPIVKDEKYVGRDYQKPTAIDFDGDGDRDLLMRAALGEDALSPYLSIREVVAETRHLLTKITDGMGKGTDVTYERGGKYGGTAYTAGERCDYPARCLRKTPHALVSRYEVSGASGSFRDPAAPAAAVTRHTYELNYDDARRDRLGRGWLGFMARTERKLASDGALLQNKRFEYAPLWSERHGDYPLRGYLLSKSVTTPLEGTELTNFVAVNHTVLDSYEWGLTSTDLPTTSFIYNVALKEHTTLWNENGLIPAARVRSNQHDKYGNVTRVDEGWLDGYQKSTIVAYHDFAQFGGALGAAVTTVHNQLTDATLSARQGRWMISQPTAVYVMAVEPQTGATTQTLSVSAYDEGGLLERMERFHLDPATQSFGRAEAAVLGHDGYGNVISSQITADGEEPRITGVDYDAAGVFPELVHNQVHQLIGASPTRVWHDPATGALRVRILPDGTYTAWNRDAFGRMQTVTDSIGQAMLVRYTQGTTPGAAMRVESDARQQPRRVTEYNAFGQRILELERDLDTQERQRKYGYDERGQLLTATNTHAVGDAAPGIHRFAYDNLGRPYVHLEPYEANGQKTVTLTVLEYASAATLGPSYRSWLRDDQSVWVTRQTRSDDSSTATVTNARELVTSSIDPENRVSTFTYDAFGYPRSRSFEGVSTLVEHDERGLKIYENDPDRGVTTAAYNGLGELKQLQRPEALTTFYYDGLGRRVRATTPAGELTWTWDVEGPLDPSDVGKLVATSAPGVSERFEYKEPGAGLSAIVRDVQGDPFTTRFDNNDGGDPEVVFYPSPSNLPLAVSYQRNSFGRVTAIRTDSTGPALWSLQELSGTGEPRVVQYGNGTSTTYTHSGYTGRLTSVVTSRGAQQVFTESYDFDSRGRLSSRSDSQGAVFDYQYDAQDRLDAALAADGSTLDYQYDTQGNLTLKPGIGSLRYEDARPHALSGSGADNQYFYDGRGNQNLRTGEDIVEGRQEIDYTWFDLPQQIRNGADGAPSLVTDFLYDSSSTKVRQLSSLGERVTYVGDIYREVDDLNGGPSVHTAIVALPDGSALELVLHAGGYEAQYRHTDALGSVRTVTGEGGGVIDARAYEPFGLESTVFGSSQVRAGFTGHETDHTNELVNMRGRLYDPVVGRFLSTDPFVQQPTSAQSWNRYSYVLNSPLNGTDPSGFEWAPEVPPPPPPSLSAADTVVGQEGAYILAHVRPPVIVFDEPSYIFSNIQPTFASSDTVFAPEAPPPSTSTSSADAEPYANMREVASQHADDGAPISLNRLASNDPGLQNIVYAAGVSVSANIGLGPLVIAYGLNFQLTSNGHSGLYLNVPQGSHDNLGYGASVGVGVNFALGMPGATVAGVNANAAGGPLTLTWTPGEGPSFLQLEFGTPASAGAFGGTFSNESVQVQTGAQTLWNSVMFEHYPDLSSH